MESQQQNQGVSRELEAIPLKYCLYARKSTESEERQVLSIDSQIKEMLELANREKMNIVEIRRESHSAKDTGQRPVYNGLINDIRDGKFNAILTWAPDRLSRNAGDLGSLVDLMDQGKLVEINTHSQKFTNNPNEKFLLMILGSQAKLENDNRGINVKRGLRAKVEMGLWPGVAPTGYLNENRSDRKCYVMIDPIRAPIIKKMFEKVANENWSGRKVYMWLKNDLNFKTKNGFHLTLSNIYIILHNSFYTGTFEYPKTSGNWYIGKHDPIISKELFDKAQNQMFETNVEKGQSREFAFTKLMTCGLCGSGITAYEKFKRQKNGNVHRYVYYNCTKGKDINCKSETIREDRLIEQITQMINDLDLDKLGMKEKVQKEVERYHSFRTGVLGIQKDSHEDQKQINMKDYAKYILQQGTILEKRELMDNLKNKLVLKNRIITILN